MKQAITGFNQDVYRDWATTKSGREEMIGEELECQLCERDRENYR